MMFEVSDGAPLAIAEVECDAAISSPMLTLRMIALRRVAVAREGRLRAIRFL